MSLDADTSRADMVHITLDDGFGTGTSVETFETDWTPWQARLRFDRYPLEKLDWVDVAALAELDPAAGPAITVANHKALLDLAIDVLTGSDHLGALDTAQGFLATVEPDATRRERGVRIDAYSCSGAGSAVARRVDDDGSGWPLPYRLTLADCDDRTYRFEGEVWGDEMRTGAGALTLESDGLDWVDGEGRNRRFSGWTSQRSGTADAPTRDRAPDGPGAAASRTAGICRWSNDGLNLSSPDVDASRDALTTMSTRDLLVEVDGAIDDSAVGGLASGGLYLPAPDDSRLFFGTSVSRDVDDTTRVVIDNSFERFPVSTPWTSWRVAADDKFAPLRRNLSAGLDRDQGLVGGAR